MAKKPLLFIDDEPFFADPYIRQLEAQFEVTLEETAIEAIATATSDCQWAAIILDIMIPAPIEKRGITADSLDTGLWILGEILQTILAKRIPVIILTNRNLPRIQEHITALADLHAIPPGLITVHQKIETERFAIQGLVISAVDRFPRVTTTLV